VSQSVSQKLFHKKVSNTVRLSRADYRGSTLENELREKWSESFKSTSKSNQGVPCKVHALSGSENTTPFTCYTGVVFILSKPVFASSSMYFLLSPLFTFAIITRRNITKYRIVKVEAEIFGTVIAEKGSDAK